MLNKKNAQVTVFIILGIVILISISLFLYLKTAGVEEEIQPVIIKTEIIPAEFAPVRDYSNNIIKNTAEEAVKKAMEHGGYIYTERIRSYQPNPTEANGFEIVPDYVIPYWYYMSQDNYCTENCDFTDNMIPPLCKQGRGCIRNGEHSIEQQISRYINENLKDRLNLSSFIKQDFQIEKKGNVISEVTIRDNDIVVYVNYHIEVKKDEIKQDITILNAVFESDLTELYTTALELTEYEANNCFIEDATRNYYSRFMGLKPDLLPPTYRDTIGTSREVTWTISNVKQNIKHKTTNALSLIGIYNTTGFRWPITGRNDPDYELNQGMLDQNVFYPMKKFRDVAIDFKYKPRWNIFLEIDPNENGVLKPSEFGVGLKMISAITQTKFYEFFYHYSFPVQVRIKKKDRLGNEQAFIFGLESNIRANRCFKTDARLWHAGSAESNLCTEEEKTKQLTISIIDDKTKEPLIDVNVAFGVLGDEVCELGATNELGELTTKYPPTELSSAFIIMEKEGYLTKFISTKEFTDNLNNIALIPAIEKKVYFRIIDMPALKQMETAANHREALDIRDRLYKRPSEQETIFATITRNKANYMDGDLSQPITFTENQVVPETIKLVPGSYNITIQMNLDQRIVIPEERVRLCDECDKITYEETELDSIQNGGAIYSNWPIDYGTLEEEGNLILYLFRQDIPKTHDELQELDAYETYSKLHDYAVYPEIK